MLGMDHYEREGNKNTRGLLLGDLLHDNILMFFLLEVQFEFRMQYSHWSFWEEEIKFINLQGILTYVINALLEPENIKTFSFPLTTGVLIANQKHCLMLRSFLAPT